MSTAKNPVTPNRLKKYAKRIISELGTDKCSANHTEMLDALSIAIHNQPFPAYLKTFEKQATGDNVVPITKGKGKPGAPALVNGLNSNMAERDMIMHGTVDEAILYGDEDAAPFRINFEQLKELHEKNHLEKTGSEKSFAGAFDVFELLNKKYPEYRDKVLFEGFAFHIGKRPEDYRADITMIYTVEDCTFDEFFYFAMEAACKNLCMNPFERISNEDSDLRFIADADWVREAAQDEFTARNGVRYSSGLGDGEKAAEIQFTEEPVTLEDGRILIQDGWIKDWEWKGGKIGGERNFPLGMVYNQDKTIEKTGILVCDQSFGYEYSHDAHLVVDGMVDESIRPWIMSACVDEILEGVNEELNISFCVPRAVLKRFSDDELTQSIIDEEFQELLDVEYLNTLGVEEVEFMTGVETTTWDIILNISSLTNKGRSDVVKNILDLTAAVIGPTLEKAVKAASKYEMADLK